MYESEKLKTPYPVLRTFAGVLISKQVGSSLRPNGMLSKTKRFRLSVNGSYPPVPAQGLIGRIVTRAAAVVLLVGPS